MKIANGNLKTIRIESDGCAAGTRVLNFDGIEIPNVTYIEILPISPDGIVRAILHVDFVAMGNG